MLLIKSLDGDGGYITEHSYTKGVMQYMKYIYICVCVCVIIKTILNVISTTTCVTNCVYSNIPRLAFMERYLGQVKCTMHYLEPLIQLCLCNVKKMFNMEFSVPRSPSQF
jgi:hypothetical protein